MRPTAFVFPVALLLTACAQDESAPVDSTVEEVTPGAPATAGGEQSLADPAPGSVTAPAPAAATIPAAMQGRWGMTPADCEPSRPDAKGLMVVEPATLQFYESRGELRQAVANGVNEVRATLAFTGEGMQWETQETLTLSADGTSLTRTSVGQDGTFGPFTYRRCP